MLMKTFIFVAIQRFLPKHWLSRQIGRIAQSRRVWLKNLLIRLAIRVFGIDLVAAERTELADYHSFNDFFTRELKLSSRSIDGSLNSIISPVDGAITQFGVMCGDRLLQAKGMNYSITKLLAGNDLSETYLNGSYMTIYLSPSDYHRVHAPCAGTLLHSKYVPGELFSVNENTTKYVQDLFSRNERLICEFESSEIGKFCLVFVGAMLVAGIETVWGGEEPSGSGFVRELNYSTRNLSYLKGDEIGRFKFGSTVILLFQRGACRWSEDVAYNRKVAFGQRIGMGRASIKI